MVVGTGGVNEVEGIKFVVSGNINFGFFGYFRAVVAFIDPFCEINACIADAVTEQMVLSRHHPIVFMS